MFVALLQPLQLPLSSPTGTLSTLPSATTASIIESPVGGLARDNSSNIFRDTSAKVTDSWCKRSSSIAARSLPVHRACHTAMHAVPLQQDLPRSHTMHSTFRAKACCSTVAAGSMLDILLVFERVYMYWEMQGGGTRVLSRTTSAVGTPAAAAVATTVAAAGTSWQVAADAADLEQRRLYR